MTIVEFRRCLLVLFFAAAMTLTARAAAAQDLLPDLEPFQASDIQLADGGNTVRFSTTSWNRGVAPMELVGGDRRLNHQGH